MGIEVTMNFLKSDLFVLMDDDGFFPEKDAVSQLVKAHEDHRLDVTNALVCSDESPNKLAFGLGRKIKTKNDAQSETGADNIIHGKANFFNGTMMSTDLIRKVGNIKKEMFIWGDEIEFLLRLKELKYNVGTFVSAVLEHPEPKVQTKKVWGLFRVSIKSKSLALNLYRNVAYLKNRYDRDTGGLIWKHMIYYLTKQDFAYARLIWQYSRDIDYKLPPINPAHSDS